MKQTQSVCVRAPTMIYNDLVQSVDKLALNCVRVMDMKCKCQCLYIYIFTGFSKMMTTIDWM